jgi:D-glycerate 3-kinase
LSARGRIVYDGDGVSMRHSVSWPTSHQVVSLSSLESHAATWRSSFRDLFSSQSLADVLACDLEAFFVPMTAWLAQRARARSSMNIIGISGGQGSGKSTLARVLAFLFEQMFGFNCAVLSMDDLYFTHRQRRDLARRAHPLFATRGVPGTHDVALGLSIIERLRRAGRGEVVALPRFDKTRDDRLSEHAWPRVSGPVHIVILEGWCLGLPPLSEHDLEQPINRLEAEQDPQGIWRHTVNNNLAAEYQTLFAQLDELIYLAVPDLEAVRTWRWQQEQELGAALMNQDQVNEFIMYFERLTRHGMAVLPERAEVVIELDRGHRFSGVQVKT